MAHPLRLLLVGPFRRRRVGGVKTHVERLRAQAVALGIQVRTIDPKKWGALLFPVWAATSDVVHLHSSNGQLVRAMTLMARALRARVIATVHANLVDLSTRDQQGFLAAARGGAELLVLNQSSADFLVHHDVPFSRVTAFLPPSNAEREAKRADTTRLQAMLRRVSADFDAVFITYVYDANYQHSDIYGIDDLLDFFGENPRWALIVLCGCNAGVLSARARLPNVMIFEGDVTVIEVGHLSNGLLRNSRTDGDSLFVQEGLYCGARVIATNVVSRPHGVELYPFGDHMRLAAALRRVIAEPRPSLSSTDRFDPMDLYCPTPVDDDAPCRRLDMPSASG
ncbi:glycosyltransferase family 1 protein [Sphingomonas sp. UNC305MFCol5.2]|uniref:glycosyltransferase family 1 protein n=1 Tax=Sphingomonas sp. UNC305MFCol5.2 TaxID=1449076 RepID=UPI0004A731DF|nr:glycosyltransferase family 1 protein [Sphingomonas sp. UNC305MFCol5.2]